MLDELPKTFSNENLGMVVLAVNLHLLIQSSFNMMDRNYNYSQLLSLHINLGAVSNRAICSESFIRN